MPTGADCKWRFMWRVGPRPDPSTTRYPELNAAPVVPAAFPEWPLVMDGWGRKMLAAVEVGDEDVWLRSTDDYHLLCCCCHHHHHRHHHHRCCSCCCVDA